MDEESKQRKREKKERKKLEKKRKAEEKKSKGTRNVEEEARARQLTNSGNAFLDGRN